MITIGTLTFMAVLMAAMAWRYRPDRAQERLRTIFGDQQEEWDASPAREAAEGGKQQRQTMFGRMELEAKRAGLNISAVQFLGLSVVVSLLGAAVAYTVFPRWYAGVAGVLAGLYAPRWWMARAKRARAAAFSRTLDAALGKMASYLRAGRSLEQAVQVAADEVEEPARTELQRAGRAIGLGSTATEALNSVAQRVDSKDFELVVVAVSILTRTGGNLAEVLQKIAQQIQERRLSRQAVLAATAQVRVTAYVVTAMPFAMTLLLRVLNPTYFGPMWSSHAGQAVMVACYGAVGLAWVWIRRILDVEVD